MRAVCLKRIKEHQQDVDAAHQDAGRAYVFVNEADIYLDADGTQYSYVTVVDTVAQEVRS